MNKRLLIALHEKNLYGQSKKMDMTLLGDRSKTHYWMGYLEALYEIESLVKNIPDPPEVDDEKS